MLLGKDYNNIKFKYTGLRKGEKLNEELFFSEEKTNKTLIDCILATQENLFKVSSIDYNKLIFHIQKNNIQEALSLFKKILPEYKLDE